MLIPLDKGESPEDAMAKASAPPRRGPTMPTRHLRLKAAVRTVTVGAIVLAVVLAIAGALLAGSLGGWQISRLRPAAALASVE